MSDSLQNPQHDGRGRGHLVYLAFVMLCFFAASSAPTPLYHVYQQAWGFSSALLTLIFAVYALSLLATLLVFGSLSDYLGRRPVIFAALVLEILSLLLFIGATDVSWLIAARVLQGIATGIATSALGAAMLDTSQTQGPLINSIAPMFGMALGALGTSALVEYAPMPLTLAYLLLLAAFVLQALYLLRVGETVTPQPGVLETLKPALSVPTRARSTLLLILPADIAAWALGGFFLSLAPSLLAAATGSTSVLNGGLAVAALSCGLTDIVTIRGGQLSPETIGAPPGDLHADYAHQADFEPTAAGVMTDYHTWYAERFAELLDKLDAIPEGSGTMLDHTIVVWTNELSTGSHQHDDLPIVVAGGTTHFRSGRLIRYAPTSPVQGPWSVVDVGRPHNQLLTSLAQAMGSSRTSVGLTEVALSDGSMLDCTGTLDGLF